MGIEPWQMLILLEKMKTQKQQITRSSSVAQGSVLPTGHFVNLAQAVSCTQKNPRDLDHDIE